MKSLLKSTTTIGLCVSLALPVPAVAQQGQRCGSLQEQKTYPCMLDGKINVTSVDELRAVRQARGDLRRAAAAEGREATLGELVQVALNTLANMRGQSGAPERGKPTVAQPNAAEIAAQLEAERQQKLERQRQEQQAAAAAAAAQQAAIPERGKPTDPNAAAAAAAQAEAERQQAEALAQAQAEAERQRQAQQAAAAAAAAQQASTPERGKPTDPNAAAVAAAAAAQAEAARQQAEAQAQERRREERRKELEAAAAAAAAAQPERGVVTEKVTQDQVRTSDQDFETAVTGQPQPKAGKGGGMSKFEKALLLGLGAVVVGSVLKNGDKVVSRSGDRVVVETPQGDLRVLKDDDALIRRPGDEVQTETFNDGSTRSTVIKPDGSRVVTIRGRDGTVLRRINIDPQGREYVLFDDIQQEQRVVVSELPQIQQSSARASVQSEAELRAALAAAMADQGNRNFSLRQIREIRQVRDLAPELELDAVRFATGSAAIRPEQARSLARIGAAMTDMILHDPRTVFLVEGHTDAVGSATYNLALSDRRAETVALALTEYFNVPPENMVTQGYGESALKIPTLQAESANRRAVVRNISSLLR